MPAGRQAAGCKNIFHPLPPRSLRLCVKSSSSQYLKAIIQNTT
jgi:hypothetical protein